MSGNLKLHSSDGQLHVRNGSGTLEARTSDGNQEIAGNFTSLQLHTSDGSITAELAEGSHLSSDSRIESSDGSVTLRLPKSFPVELAISTSDGSIQSTLPLVIDGYNSKGNSGHSIRGKFNGGGSLLTIHTSDGSVHLTTTLSLRTPSLLRRRVINSQRIERRSLITAETHRRLRDSIQRVDAVRREVPDEQMAVPVGRETHRVKLRHAGRL